MINLIIQELVVMLFLPQQMQMDRKELGTLDFVTEAHNLPQIKTVISRAGTNGCSFSHFHSSSLFLFNFFYRIIKKYFQGGVMKSILELNSGFADAVNYQKREHKELFNSIFVKNDFLVSLLKPDVYFLIGEKGTGKTAYSVFMANNNYKETLSILKYIRETDYQKFVSLKKNKQLELSDYTSIWKVVILLLLAKSISKEELDHNPFSKTQRLKSLLQAIDDYYKHAFSPEIVNALVFVEDSKSTAELVLKYLNLSGEKHSSVTFNESKFQVNLLFLENKFKDALSTIKLKQNHFLFIDGIDIRPAQIPYSEYLDCVKGLANAIWNLNNDFFSQIKDSKGRLKVILLSRPDIFNSIGLQNMTNKVRDNSVFLDWRTTYPDYKTSQIYTLADQFLAAQQDIQIPFSQCWEYYFPWRSRSTNKEREYDDSFIDFLRISYSTPRDMVTIISLLKDIFIEKKRSHSIPFQQEDFKSDLFQNRYSEYLMGGVRDQLAFYYDNSDYEMFLRFFSFLENRADFNFVQYKNAYDLFTEYVLNHHSKIPEFIETADSFLQFLYDTNIICYIEETSLEPLFRWCYRERSYSNISPKVKVGLKYRIHYGLHKALNVGMRAK